MCLLADTLLLFAADFQLLHHRFPASPTFADGERKVRDSHVERGGHEVLDVRHTDRHRNTQCAFYFCHSFYYTKWGKANASLPFLTENNSQGWNSYGQMLHTLSSWKGLTYDKALYDCGDERDWRRTCWMQLNPIEEKSQLCQICLDWLQLLWPPSANETHCLKFTNLRRSSITWTRNSWFYLETGCPKSKWLRPEQSQCWLGYCYERVALFSPAGMMIQRIHGVYSITWSMS